ncbi:MAG: hypothetical protein KAJ12_09775 [Bacteroidetes bacterium]|nr:hypothetical protein [Bacteroidota bacterium]
MGGPASPGAQLLADNQKKESFFRVPSNWTRGWYEWKSDLREKTGIQLGLNYTALFMWSSAVIDEAVNSPTASSGILDLIVGWKLLGRTPGTNTSTLFLRVNSRHSYISGKTAPMFHGLSESGYYGLPAVGYHDYTIRVIDLTWQQGLFGNRMGLIVGKFDPTNYFNFHGLMVPWTSFIGYGASVSNTINWPNTGVGVAFGFKITSKVFVLGTLSDLTGETWEEGKFLDWSGDHFFDGRFFKVLELGYAPTIDERYFKKISLTYWHSSALPVDGGTRIEPGSGLALSYHWWFNERYMPYVRLAFGNGTSARARRSLDVEREDVDRAFEFIDEKIRFLGTYEKLLTVPSYAADKTKTEKLKRYQFIIREFGGKAVKPDEIRAAVNQEAKRGRLLEVTRMTINRDLKSLGTKQTRRGTWKVRKKTK